MSMYLTASLRSILDTGINLSEITPCFNVIILNLGLFIRIALRMSGTVSSEISPLRAPVCSSSDMKSERLFLMCELAVSSKAEVRSSEILLCAIGLRV